jgi:hypothetical protein
MTPREREAVRLAFDAPVSGSGRQPGSGRPEGRQQLGLAMPGSLDMALLDVAVAADVLRDLRDLDRQAIVLG